MEFFLGIFIAFPPGEPAMFDVASFNTHGECTLVTAQVEQYMAAQLPEGTEIRMSCVSSESIGQNSV